MLANFWEQEHESWGVDRAHTWHSYTFSFRCRIGPMEQTNYRRQFDGNVARLGKRRKDQKSEIEEQIGELGVGGQIVLGDLFCSFLLLTLFSHLSWRGQNWDPSLTSGPAWLLLACVCSFFSCRIGYRGPNGFRCFGIQRGFRVQSADTVV
jgi:hypothetical protein